MKVCLKCNKDNNNDGEYCVFCGEKLTEEESKIKENALGKKQGTNIEDKTTLTNEIKKVNRNKKDIIFILILIVLIICLGIYVIKLSNNSLEFNTQESELSFEKKHSDNNDTKIKLSKEKFDEKWKQLEENATEIWVNGKENDTIYDRIIIVDNKAFRFTKFIETYYYYQITYKKYSNNVVEISYDDVNIKGKIYSNKLELYMADEYTIYGEYIKK